MTIRVGPATRSEPAVLAERLVGAWGCWGPTLSPDEDGRAVGEALDAPDRERERLPSSVVGDRRELRSRRRTEEEDAEQTHDSDGVHQ